MQKSKLSVQDICSIAIMAALTPAVKDVLPVPPLPDTTAMHCPRRSMGPLLSQKFVYYYTTNFLFVKHLFRKKSQIPHFILL